MNILLVGCGKMGGALLTRWQNLKIAKEICVIEPSGSAMPGVTLVRAFQELPKSFQPDVVIFAVKPQILGEMAPAYKVYADNGALIISIAAGKSVSFFEGALGAGAKIVRSMPNTPAAIGEGVTVACANKNVSDAEKAITEKLLGAVGDVLWVDQENLLNPVTALSGSGPAYVFLLIEAMAAAGVKAGLDPVMAQKLARQTVIGSAALAKDSADVTVSQLRENVTSPNGTTAAALNVLMAPGGMQKIFDEAILAATKRAEELSQ